MNPMRPDCLKNDYTKGCKILRDAYNSLFESFASIIQSQTAKQNDETSSKKSASGVISPNDSKMKRQDSHDSERTKKHKLLPPILTSQQNHEHKGTDTRNYHDESSDAPNQAREENSKKNGAVTKKNWGSWAQALYEVAMHPEKYKNSDSILETSDEVVVLKDLYPKVL
jgi:aprataxin